MVLYSCARVTAGDVFKENSRSCSSTLRVNYRGGQMHKFEEL